MNENRTKPVSDRKLYARWMIQMMRITIIEIALWSKRSRNLSPMKEKKIFFLTEEEGKRKKKNSFEPDSNQRPKDDSMTSTVLRSTN